MWARFIANNMDKTRLLTLTIQHFHPLPTREVELLFDVATSMLNSLNEKNPDFDHQYNKIVFGTIVIAVIIENSKMGINYYPHSITKKYNMGALSKTSDSSATEERILYFGSKILSNELPFNSADIDQYFPALTTNVPSIKERFKRSMLNMCSLTDQCEAMENKQESIRYVSCSLV